MPSITITEALASIKTTQKRIVAKRTGLLPFLFREEVVRDPLEKTGGSTEFVRRELQAIKDLQTRIVLLRCGIAAANHCTYVSVGCDRKTIEEWLVWRRDVAPTAGQILQDLRTGINEARARVLKHRVMVAPNAPRAGPEDVVANFDEQDLYDQIERHELIMGELDGVLSRANATTYVTTIE